MIHTFADVVPLRLHETLAKLGRLDWLRVSADKSADSPGDPVHFSIRWPVLQEAGLADWLKGHLDGMDERGKADRRIPLLMWMDAFGGLLAEGPKLFKPTAEQFESFQHVDITVPLSDLRAPYPAILMVVPHACRVKLAADFGVPLNIIPSWALARDRQTDSGFFIASHVPKEKGRTWEDITHFFLRDHNKNKNTTVEQGLRHRLVERDKDEIDFDISMVIERAALNLCLFMTHYGCRVAGPVDPVAYSKHRKKPALRKFAAGDMLAVEMVQHIVVRGQRPDRLPGDRSAEPTYEYDPKWVRGHWRRYPGYRDVLASGGVPRQVFVRPYITHRDRIVGDLSETTVVYEGRDERPAAETTGSDSGQAR